LTVKTGDGLLSIYVNVTRKADPLGEGPEITRDEWLELVSSDPDLSLERPSDAFAGDKTEYAAWKGYPGGYTAWFGFADGNISVKGIDDAILAKLRQFARRLDANIISDEGEQFS
jgi:hypothetical protein